MTDPSDLQNDIAILDSLLIAVEALGNSAARRYQHCKTVEASGTITELIALLGDAEAEIKTAASAMTSDLADEIWRLSDGPAGESRHLAGLQAWMDGGRSR